MPTEYTSERNERITRREPTEGYGGYDYYGDMDLADCVPTAGYLSTANSVIFE